MKKQIIKFLISFFFIYFIYGLFLSQYSINIIPDELEPKNPAGFYDYSGVMNVHSINSSGSGALEDIVFAAKNSNVDFLVLTDSNHFNRTEDRTSYLDDVLILDEAEYSYLDSKLIVFGRKDLSMINSFGSAQVVLSDLLSRSTKEPDEGKIILAHPNKESSQWQGEYPPGIDGIELINLKEVWQTAWLNSKASFFWTLLSYPFNPELSFIRLFETPEKELRLWDNLNNKRKTIGYASADAEAKVKLFGSEVFNIPSYETLFSIVKNHVLLESELTGIIENDIKNIRAALKKGQFYLSADIMANPKGFNAIIKNTGNQIYPMGSKIKFEEGLNLTVTLPSKPITPFEIVIYKDGTKLLSSNSAITEYNILEPGIYRAIVRVIPTLPLPDGKKWLTWIITNPFFIK